jgi:hypothetical protein
MFISAVGTTLILMIEQFDGQPTNRTMRRRQFLRAAGVAGVTGATAVLAGSTTVFADEGEGSPTGAWLETITSTDGSFPSFKVLFTYAAGGGLTGTASIDSMAGLKSSPTHGAWKSVNDRTFRWTGHAFSFDDAGNPNGYYNIKETIKLAQGGNAYAGNGTFEVVDGPGAIPLTPYNVSGVRISA